MRHKKKAPVPYVKFIVPGLFVLIFLYILNQVLYGERGVFIWHDLTVQVQDLKTENNALESYAQSFRNKAKRLNRTNPDVDYMDELVRENLAVSQQNETIIFIPKTIENTPIKKNAD